MPLEPIAFGYEPARKPKQDCCGGSRYQYPNLGSITDIRFDHRSALLTIAAIVVRPATRLRNATPTIKRPLELFSRDIAKSRFITYIRPPTTKGRTANTPADALASAVSARAF